MNSSATLRSMLATEGIFLDEQPVAPKREAIATTAVPRDREAIRKFLLERGAPERDVEWLTTSCPSTEDAREFEPTEYMLRPEAAKGQP